MGYKDTATIKYMEQNDIFADVFNYYIYDGEQVIDPNSLVELDTREIGIPYGGKDGKEIPTQKIRDLIRSAAIMTDNRNAYLLLAIENQANIHYAMPVKNMLSDALQYAKQVERLAHDHRISGNSREFGSDEFLSGIVKSDKLVPVVTLVVYFDTKEWDGPLSLHEMLGETDDRVLTFVPDYKINLIAPASIPDEDFDKFRTTLKEVFSFIKSSRDADKMNELMKKDEKFRQLGRKEVDVLNSCTGAKLKMSENEEVFNVCEAIQELNRRNHEQGVQEGISGTVAVLKKLGQSASQIKTLIMEQYSLSSADAERYL